MAEDGERVAVSTYVPAAQRDRWREHAERLDMSQSEFVRTMVQAGRRGFEPRDGDDPERNPGETDRADATPRGDGLETAVIDRLGREDYLSWDALVDELTDDIEERLDEVLADLQDRGRIRYSGRHDGYVLRDEDGE